VEDHTDGLNDRLTPGGMFTIKGRGLGTFADVPLSVGVYVTCTSTNSLVRVNRYVRWLDNEIRGYWPTGLEGPFWLFVETHSANGWALSAVHTRPLSQRCAPAAPHRPD
jgi:hypothetical protein